MRIAIIGATGSIGRRAVDAVRRYGHEPVPVSRSTGVDVLTGDGLADALTRVDAVIDTLNTTVREADATVKFFGTTTSNLLAAEERAGVRHHVLLSIVGIHRIEGNPHY